MLSGKVAAVIAVAILAVFSAITIETIGHSGSSLSSSSLSGASSDLTMYSAQNGTAFMVTSPNASLNVSVSLTSLNATSVYVYDISPLNLTPLQQATGPALQSLPNLTHMNQTLYPYDYQMVNVTSGANTTVNLMLFINSTDYSQMEVSNPASYVYHPYVVEILAESSTGAAAIGFTLLKV